MAGRKESEAGGIYFKWTRRVYQLESKALKEVCENLKRIFNIPINPELTQDIYSCPQALPPPEHLNKGGGCSLTDLFLQGLQGLHAGPLCTLECSDQSHRGVAGDHSRVGNAPSLPLVNPAGSLGGSRSQPFCALLTPDIAGKFRAGADPTGQRRIC